PQRAGLRRVPGPGRPRCAGAGAPGRPGRGGRDRGALAGLSDLQRELRGEPDAAPDRGGARPRPARIPGLDYLPRLLRAVPRRDLAHVVGRSVPRRREHRPVLEEGRRRVRRVRPFLRQGGRSVEGPAVRRASERPHSGRGALGPHGREDPKLDGTGRARDGPAVHDERSRFPRRVVRGRPGEGRPGHTVGNRRVVRTDVSRIRLRADAPLDRRGGWSCRRLGLGPRWHGRGLHSPRPRGRVGRRGDPRERRGGAGSQRGGRPGGESRANAEVQRVAIDGSGRSVGVELSDGSLVRARRVVSNAHPITTYLDLVGEDRLPDEVVRDIKRYRTRSGSVKVNVALSELPSFPSWDQEGRFHMGLSAVSPSIEYLERAWDDAKYGRPSEHPYVEVVFPTAHEEGLAPQGKHVMLAFCQYGPYELRSGSWDDERQRLGKRVIQTVGQFAPNLPGAVEHIEVLAPPDIEARFGLIGGNIM